MKTLNYQTLEDIGYDGYLLKGDAPEKVLQFGEGNFLRAFADLFIDRANELLGYNAKVVLVQPKGDPVGDTHPLNLQEDLYTVYKRGNNGGRPVDERRVISCCSRCFNAQSARDWAQVLDFAVADSLECVISNTTEAGIAYDPSCTLADETPESFPAKLVQVLYRRWKAGKPGLVILSCELIENNGAELERICLLHARDWELEEEFSAWMQHECRFCTTLVDSIVPGAIRDSAQAEKMGNERGYIDSFADVREVFDMWGVQGEPDLAEKLPFLRPEVGGVFITPDVTPYKKRKVRILNGAHTGFVPGAWLAGFTIVRESLQSDVVRGFMREMLGQEVIPTMTQELDQKELEEFAHAVEERFDNPFVDHQLLSICLNSVSKWRARNMPSLLDYVEQTGELPCRLTLGLAALLAFYTTGFEGLDEAGLHLRRADGAAYVAQDDAAVLSFFAEHSADDTHDLVMCALANEEFWGQDLTKVDGLAKMVEDYLAAIRTEGMLAAFEASCR